MYEFPNFVYLDMEKTGSTFIFQVLKKFSAEEEIRREHHMPMEANCDRSKFYFISVRDPLDAYISLYSFGCEARGKARARFNRLGIDHHYDGTTEGFDSWLRFALKKRNAQAIAGDRVGDNGVAELMGPQSYRYFRLAVPDARERLAECTTQEEIHALYAREKLPAFVVRHENFTKDLAELIRGPLRDWINDVDAAVNYVETAVPRNTSKRVDKKNSDFTVDFRLRKRLSVREWFLRELFGY